MWEKIKDLILKLFGVKLIETSSETEHNAKNANAFQAIDKENIIALVANSLSSVAFSDAGISIIGESKRAEYLNEIAKSHWKNIRQLSASCLGTGMIISIPYSVNNGLGRKIYIDTITRERFYVTGRQGDEITACTVLADRLTYKGKKYERWTDYSVENGVYVIRQKAMQGDNPCPLSDVPAWAGVQEEIRISGVDRLPIGIMYCPANSRNPRITGVPITYGCDATLKKISDTFEDIEKEFKNKKIKVFADRLLLNDGKFDEDLYVRFGSSDNFTCDVFDPAFRDTSYYAKLQNHFLMLEKEIGCSRGILTELSTKGATATEIRRSMFNTFALCDSVHTQFEAYFDNLIYGVNVLCNYYGLTPPGEYEIVYNWSYALLEDTSETFKQISECIAQSAAEPAELRQFTFPNETLEESKKRCAEIAENSPTLKHLVGE